MSEPLEAALHRAKLKLVRQTASVAATEAEIEALSIYLQNLSKK